MKRTLFFIIIFISTALSAWGDPVPYVVRSSDGKTLTFKYGEKAVDEGETAYDINTSNWSRTWAGSCSSVETVVFHDSFSSVTPTTCAFWFASFENLTEIQDINYLNTSAATSMQQMFYQCKKITALDLSHFNTANVTNMANMFSSCENLTSITFGENFRTSNVTTMRSMFYLCKKLAALDLSYFDTSNVTDMYWMFLACQSLESLNLSSFNTVNVTNMYQMFSYCSKMSSLILGSTFDTGNVTTMEQMFAGCSNLLSLNLGSKFDTRKVTGTGMQYMFSSCSKLEALNLGSNFDTSKVTSMSSLFSGCNKLSTIALGDKFDTSNVTDMSYMFSGCNSLSSLSLGDIFNTSKVTSMACMFYGCNSLSSLFLGANFDTSEVTTMTYMFSGCSSLSSLSLGANFSTSKVTNMSYMFNECKKLTSLSLGNKFNTSLVTDMQYMFYYCSELTSLDLSNFSNSSVTNMYQMFGYCSKLTSLNLSGFNTGQVTNMSYMFRDCSSLAGIDLSSFDTSKVTDVSSMFNNCSELISLDISNFNVGNVTNAYGIFSGCQKMEGITLGKNFDTRKLTASNQASTKWQDMFKNCSKLGLIIIKGNANNLSGSIFANIGTSNNCELRLVKDDNNEILELVIGTGVTLDRSTGYFSWRSGKFKIVDGKQAYQITKSSVTGGTIAVGSNWSWALPDETVKLTKTPSSNYAFDEFIVKKTSDENILVTVNENEGNYSFVMPGYAVTVSARFLKSYTPTISLAGWIYGSTANAPTLTNKLGDGVETYSYWNGDTQLDGAPQNAGDYTVKVAIAKTETYAAAAAEADFTIAQRVATLNWDNLERPYNGSAQEPTITVSNLVEGDDCNVTISYDEGPYYDYTATAGTTGQTSGTITHFYHYLVDGVLTLPNVWCTFKDNKSNGVWYVEFNTAEPVNPISYTVVTGADTQSFPDRNPKSWELKAKLNAGDEWTTIATVTNDSQLEAQNNKAYNYDLDVTGGTYQYFRFEVSERRGSATTYDIDPMQLAELFLNVSRSAPREIGEHTAHVVALSNPNYALPNTVADLTKNFTITQKEVTLNWPETTAFTYDGQAKDYKPTLGDVINDECALVMSYDDEYTSYSCYTATAGSGSDYSKVVDGDLTTKWYVETSNRTNGVWFVEFNTSESICPVGYTLITGDNTSSNSHLNPMFWKLKAKKTPGDDWTTIATVKNDNILQAKNKQAYDYRLDVIGESYQYYRLEISGAHKKTTATEWDTGMQLQDFHLLVPKEAPVNVGSHTAITALTNSNYKLPTPANHAFTIGGKNISSASITFDSYSVDYTGDPVKPTVTVSDLNGSTECITADDYEISGEGTDPGSYSLTVSAKANGNYTGSVTTEAYKIVYPLTPAKNYTTYVSPFDLQMPEGESGLKAYTVASITDTEVILQEETAVFKNEPMILVGTAENTYRLEKKDEGKTISTTHSDKLKAGSVVCSADKYYYVLQNNGTGAEFVWANSGTVPAGKCYLDLGTTSGARNRSLSIVIDGNTTSLDDIINRDFADDKWYDLQGRRIEQPQKKGLYILNGKKVVVK